MHNIDAVFKLLSPLPQVDVSSPDDTQSHDHKNTAIFIIIFDNFFN